MDRTVCGVVGYKPTPGRWPSAGIAPISSTLDTAGVFARNVEDCELLDVLMTVGPGTPPAELDRPRPSGPSNLKSVRLAYAPRQHLSDVDGEVDSRFRETLRLLRDAGAELVEVDLGQDFFALANRTTWAGRAPQNHLDPVLGSSPESISDEQYLAARCNSRRELRCRLGSLAFAQASALLLPTTPCPAPLIDEQWEFEVARKKVTDVFLSRHTHPASAAGVPAISIPSGLTAQGLPLGIELEAPADDDQRLLALAQRVQAVIGSMAAPC